MAYVYLFINKDKEGVYKIGKADCIVRRLSDINSPLHDDLIGLFKCWDIGESSDRGAVQIEHELHNMFKEKQILKGSINIIYQKRKRIVVNTEKNKTKAYKRNTYREWFVLSDNDLRQIDIFFVDNGYKESTKIIHSRLNNK